MGMPVVSKSNLCDFIACPYTYHYNTENGIVKKSDAMALGSLVDCICLTPELYTEQYRVDEKRIALKKDGTPYANGMQCPQQKEEWAKLAEQGINIITPEQENEAFTIAKHALEHMDTMGITLSKNAETQLALWAVLNEIDGVQLDTPIILCAMLDIVTDEDNAHIVDQKTTSINLSDTSKLRYHITDYGYGTQAAIYTDLYAIVTGFYPFRFSLLFAQTTEPHLTRCVVISDESLEYYGTRYKQALIEYARAAKSNNWGTPQLRDLVF